MCETVFAKPNFFPDFLEFQKALLIFFRNPPNVEGKYMFIVSIKDIKPGDELTANYNLYTYPKTGVGLQTF